MTTSVAASPKPQDSISFSSTSLLRRGAAIPLAVVLTLLMGPAARAGTLTGQMVLTLDNVSRYNAPGGTTVSLYNQATGGSVVNDGHADVSQGGSFLWKINPGSSYTGQTFDNPNVNNPSVNDPSHVLTFCIEINQNIGWGGTYTYQISSLKNAPEGEGASPGMGTQAAFLIEQLWQQRFHSIFSPAAGDSSLLSTDHDILAGAFQLAIWKLEYDAGDSSMTYVNGDLTNADFTTGFLRVDGLKKDSSNASAVVKQAEKWLDGLSLNYTGPLADLYALTNPGAQDQLVADPPVPAPEPASIAVWLVIGSLAAYGQFSRRSVAAVN